MRVGVIQGRLSPPSEGFQECPVNWKREFDLLPGLGLSHVEWIITKKSFIDNPFFSCDLRGYPIHTVCADNLVDERIDDETFMQVSLNPICKAAARSNVEYITIPLLEDSSVQEERKRLRFKKILRGFAEQYPNIHFSLEAELERWTAIPLSPVMGKQTLRSFLTSSKVWDIRECSPCKQRVRLPVKKKRQSLDIYKF